jgi:hypothetical protein
MIHGKVYVKKNDFGKINIRKRKAFLTEKPYYLIIFPFLDLSYSFHLAFPFQFFGI